MARLLRGSTTKTFAFVVPHRLQYVCGIVSRSLYVETVRSKLPLCVVGRGRRGRTLFSFWEFGFKFRHATLPTTFHTALPLPLSSEESECLKPLHHSTCSMALCIVVHVGDGHYHHRSGSHRSQPKRSSRIIA